MADLQRSVEAFYTKYNIALDDLALDSWVDMFDEVCLYRIVSRENWEAKLPLSTMMCDSKGMLADRVKGIQQTMMFAPRYCRRFISSLQIEDPVSDLISARSSFLCVQTLNDQPSEVAFCGVAHDMLVQEKAELKIRSRICVLDTEMIPNSLIYPL